MPPPQPKLPSTRAFLSDLFSALPKPSVSTTTSSSSNPLADVAAGDRNVLLTLHVLFPNEFLPALDLLDRNLVTRFRVRGDERDDDEGEPRNGGDRNNDDDDNNILITSSTATTNQQPPSNLRAATSTSNPDDTDNHEKTTTTISLPHHTYYVRSAQAPPSRFASSTTSSSSSRAFADPSASNHGSGGSGASYEVRLDSWNCSCPAFAFAAFPPDDGPEGEGAEAESEDRRDAEDAWLGGEDNGDEGEEDDENCWYGGLALGTRVPVCKHLLACVLVERCALFRGCVEERVVTVEEAAGWAAGWGD